MATLPSQLALGSHLCHMYLTINAGSRYSDSGCPTFLSDVLFSLCLLFVLQASPVFYSTSICTDKFGDLEMVSSQSSEEGEKEKSPLPHPEPLTAVFQQSGSQSPDSRLVSEMPVSSSSGEWRGLGGQCALSVRRFPSLFLS